MSRIHVLMPLLALGAAGCVAYTPLQADLSSVATAVQARAGGRVSFAAAVALAMQQNADVLAAAARARAAGAATEPVVVEAEWRGDQDMLSVMVDPFAVLGIGPRGGALAELDAAAVATAQELAVVRWRTIAAVAEAFLVEHALAAAEAPQLGDAANFERAGLASPVAAQRLRAARARAAAEAAEVGTLRAQNLAELRAVLGLPPGARLQLEAGDDGELLRQPPGDDDALLQRPDLLLAQARLHVADAEFRRAVADQYPSLMVGPDIPLTGDPLQAMARLSLPIGMHGRAAAARERRDAAIAELQGAWLEAANGAAAAASALDAAEAIAAATTAARQASDDALRTATVAVQVELDAFDPLADAAAMAVRDAIEERMAAVALARARVRRAVAFGWPRSLAPNGDEGTEERP